MEVARSRTKVRCVKATFGRAGIFWRFFSRWCWRAPWISDPTGETSQERTRGLCHRAAEFNSSTALAAWPCSSCCCRTSGSHFPDQPRVPTIMRYIGMVASPSFVLLNGILIGFLCRFRSGWEYRRLRTVFVDRALFLLTAGHLLLLGSHAPAYTLRFFSITDTIAVCLLVSPFLADKLSARNRVLVGVITYLASGIALGSWHPHSEMGAILEESAVGSLNPWCTTTPSRSCPGSA